MNALEIKNVSHSFGDKKVLNKINLTIPAGQFVSLIGPSGCGKSTLLKAILGTHPPKSGEIFAEDNRVLSPSRNVGIVYQHYSLYDFLTVEKNVSFGLTQDKTSFAYRTFGYFFGWKDLKKKHLQEANNMLKKVGLESAAKYYPAEMSGGMKQRVAIAQALVMQPKVLLLDEPFGALDEATREELQNLIVSLYNENKIAKKQGKIPPYTIIIVTHELNEAIYLADRVIGLSQYHADGSNGATIIYDRPATAFNRSSERDYGLFVKQKEELRETVFNEDNNLPAEEYVTFWDDYQNLNGISIGGNNV